MANLIQEFFLDPILNYSGYNPINTIVYAIILLAISFFFIYPFFTKKGIKFDWQFMKAVIPFIVLGATIRIFEETYSNVFLFQRSANPLELGFYTITPGIYIAIGILTILTLIFSIFLGKKINKNPTTIFGIIGTILALPIVLFHLTKLVHITEFIAVFLIVGGILAILQGLFKIIKKPIFQNKLNIAAIAAHSMDAAATFTALSFFSTFSEQHFVSNFIIQTFSPFAFIIVKVTLIVIIIHLLDKEITDPNLNGFIKILIAILGFAPGIRDTFSIGLTLLN